MISAILKGKCPKCQEGDIYVNKSVFPLSKCMALVDHCPKCGQKIKSKNDNAPGMNYAVSVVVYALGFIIYALIWGISATDNSMIYSFVFATVLVIILQPWLMRLSKTIYLYLFVKFKNE